MRVSAPPFLYPCYYGTDIDSQEHLIACHHTVEEIAKLLDVDSLAYLPLERLGDLCGSDGYCSACFSGCYPTAIPADTRKDQFEQKLSVRKAGFDGFESFLFGGGNKDSIAELPLRETGNS